MLSLSLLRLEMDWRGWASFSNRGILKMVSTPKIKELHSVDEFIPFIIQNFMASLAQLNFRPVLFIYLFIYFTLILNNDKTFSLNSLLLRMSLTQKLDVNFQKKYTPCSMKFPIIISIL